LLPESFATDFALLVLLSVVFSTDLVDLFPLRAVLSVLFSDDLVPESAFVSDIENVASFFSAESVFNSTFSELSWSFSELVFGDSSLESFFSFVFAAAANAIKFKASK